MVKNIVEFKKVTKVFPGVVALNSVDLEFCEGETHVLVGENGAGKSTLIKILCGVYRPDEGEILFEGQAYAPSNTLEAMHTGVRCVYQEFNLLPYMTVAENIFFEDMPQKHGIVDFKKLNSDAEILLQKVGLKDVSPTTPVELLGIAQKQLLEIAKAISKECKVLILDEPTATLTPPEIESLFKIIANLKKDGVTIIYISHRLEELKIIGDKISVLRNGEYVGTWNIDELTSEQIVQQMVGRKVDATYPHLDDVHSTENVLEVKDFVVQGTNNPISFSLKKGEILGIAGLVGSGRTEAVRALFGADTAMSGDVLLNGKTVKIKTPKDAVKAGIAFVTEDRKGEGLLLPMNCIANTTLPDIKSFSTGGYLRKKQEIDATDSLIRELGTKVSSARQTVGNLSGGNQQKIVLAKWLLCKPSVIILDEPTRGIDVNAKREIYLILCKLIDQGVSILFVSSDMSELIGVCHRIAVFSNRKIAGEVERSNFDAEKILNLAYKEY
ncbi:MAG: sugar ABC transporter ATP-binding protein [Spirochaetales bacterium]